MDYDQTVAGHLRARDAYEQSIRDNSGGHARCELTWLTIGVGEANTSVALPFNVRFIEEPAFTSGFTLTGSVELVSGHYPRVSTGVYDWHIDNKGYYIGAWVFFTVDTIGPGAVLGDEPSYSISHHLKFEGKAIKDVPAHLLDF